MLAGVVGNQMPKNHTFNRDFTFGNSSMSNSFAKNRRKLHCTHCKRDNHIVDKSFYINGFPPGYKA